MTENACTTDISMRYINPAKSQLDWSEVIGEQREARGKNKGGGLTPEMLSLNKHNRLCPLTNLKRLFKK